MNVEDQESSGAERSTPSRPDGGSPRGAPPFVVAGRVLLLLVAAAGLVGSILRARAHDHAALASMERYVCPMHPEVESSTPGDCPICNMALVPARGAEQSESRMATGGQVVAKAQTRDGGPRPAGGGLDQRGRARDGPPLQGRPRGSRRRGAGALLRGKSAEPAVERAPHHYGAGAGRFPDRECALSAG